MSERDFEGFSEHVPCSYCRSEMVKVWTGSLPSGMRLDAWSCPNCLSVYYESRIEDPFYQTLMKIAEAQRGFYKSIRAKASIARRKA